MERHEILQAMGELKLYGMRASFDEIAGKGLARRDELYPLIASLIRAEPTHRQARSISYRIAGAKFPVLKDIDTFVFADTPVDEGQVRERAGSVCLNSSPRKISGVLPELVWCGLPRVGCDAGRAWPDCPRKGNSDAVRRSGA